MNSELMVICRGEFDFLLPHCIQLYLVPDEFAEIELPSIAQADGDTSSASLDSIVREY